MPAATVDDGLADWLRLAHCPGLSRAAVRRLLARHGPPAQVLRAVLRSPHGADETAREALLAAREAHAARLIEVSRWLQADARHRVMALDDPDWPEPWLQTADPPLLVYLAGDARCLVAPSVAIVGSRRPTPQGRVHALTFARGLARQGWTVVSGLAAGIDAAAHDGALQAFDEASPCAGRTIAIVGTGLDQVYPRAHQALAQRITAHGLLVSEYPLGTPPLAPNFPRRNRLIAGLSRGTLVVEAALRSGSLITARLALEAGREVMAIPGSVLAEQAAGCHALIRDGAALVTSVEEVVAELGPLAGRWAAAPPASPALSALPVAPDAGPAPSAARASPRRAGTTAAPAAVAPEAAGDAGRVPAAAVASAAADLQDAVLQALGHDPLDLDALIDRCGWPAARLQAHLMALELDGRVARLPGGLYQAQRRA
ncbi:MAG: DNA-protecting protein DprA [Pseudomonadota bacterium]|jgi:DNA processing protein